MSMEDEQCEDAYIMENEQNMTREAFTNHSISRVCEQLIRSGFSGDKSEKCAIGCCRVKLQGAGERWLFAQRCLARLLRSDSP